MVWYDAIEMILIAQVDWLIMLLDRDLIRRAPSDSLLSAADRYNQSIQ